MRSLILVVAILMSSCSPGVEHANPRGRYVSDTGDIQESVTLMANGTYAHDWILNGPQAERGRWSFHTGKDTDCPTLELSDFTVVRRDDRPTSRNDTYVACIDTTLFGQAFIVLNADRGVYLRKTD